MQSLGWITVEAAGASLAAIGTLGPEGTSSEQAAHLLWRELAPQDAAPCVRLYDRYEMAADALRANEVSHFVVANAYRNVNEFYMDNRLALRAVFVMDTPLYGLARPEGGKAIPRSPTIASHPSPVPLIMELLPAEYTAGEITIMPSTSAAAVAVRQQTTDLALTTENAAKVHGLTFISPTRPIRMVWSVFTRDEQ